MKYIFHALIAVMLSLVATACSISEFAEIEPTGWEKRQFEENIARSVRKAVHTPGIDNGSTIIVTTSGDTLVTPTDSVFAAAPLRTVYVDIQSPVYPKKYSSRSMEVLAIIGVTGSICLFVLLILLGVFIVIVRRQHGRNKIINHAIADNYNLPESYFTGQPQQAPVTINNITSYIPRPAAAGQPDSGNQQSGTPGATAGTPGTAQEPPCYNSGAEPVDASNVNDFLRNLGINDSPVRLKKFRNAVVLIGLGFIFFFTCAAVDNPGLGFFVGGILALLGAAQLITLLLGRKF